MFSFQSLVAAVCICAPASIAPLAFDDVAGEKSQLPKLTFKKGDVKKALNQGWDQQEGRRDDGDGEEFPGKVKSADPGRRLLVITLLNGKDRSFLLSKDVKISVSGPARARYRRSPRPT
jgi:hypothetical protein